MSHLFSPLALGPLRLPNRIVVPPMCQYSSVDGHASSWHHAHWPQLALSGAGLVIVEATAVEPAGRISWADLGLYDDATERAFADALAAARRWSPTAIGVQLAHAGRKASSHRPWDHAGRPLDRDDPRAWQTVSASAQGYRDSDPTPQALDDAGIERVVAAFVDSAQRAVRAGVDLVELHAAHGYLLHQFLSPLSNLRDDAHGGALEHRMRLTLRVFDAVRAVLPAQVALGVRISASDWVPGGWDLAQSLVLARALEARGSHFIHVSSGGLDARQQVAAGPGYQVGFAEAIRREVATPVIAVGLITEPAQAEAILAAGQADAIGVARGLLFDPRWPWHAAQALGASVATAPQYLRAAPQGQAGLLQPYPPTPGEQGAA